MTDEQHADSAKPAGHEPDLVNGSRVVWTSAGLVLLVVFSLGLMYGLLFALNREPAAGEESSLVKLPPPTLRGPALNPNQPRRLQTLRAHEDALLGHYDWVDREQGIARIPIGRAMAILAARGLPETQPNKESSDDIQSDK